MAFTDTPYFGNVTTSEATAATALDCGKIKIVSSGGSSVFDFSDRLFFIEGVKWRPNRMAYDYEAGVGDTRQQVRRVIDYKAIWRIVMRYAGRDTFNELMRLESIMDGTVFDFTNGLRPDKRYYLTPPGDSTAPQVEIVKTSKPDVDTKLFGDKHLAYVGHELFVESVQAYDTKHLPVTIAPITSLISGISMMPAYTVGIDIFA